MRAGFAIKPSDDSIERVARHGTPSLIDRIREVLAICSRAMAAAHFYEEHKVMSDPALADKGLKRADLPRTAFAKLTEGS